MGCPGADGWIASAAHLRRGSLSGKPARYNGIFCEDTNLSHNKRQIKCGDAPEHAVLKDVRRFPDGRGRSAKD
jgi:hypothetical protein